MNRDGDGPDGPKLPRRNYEVGYGKPPKDYQFKPGQSGNMAGRPRQNKSAGVDFTNLHASMYNALNRKIIVVEGGKKRKVRVRDAIILRMIQGTLNGEKNALAQCLKLAEKSDQAQAAGMGPQEMRIIIEGGLPDNYHP